MDNRPIGIYDSGIGGLTGLKALRRLLPGEDLVFFADPIRDRRRIRAWYCRADLFLFPSTFDTNGLVVREAAACGLGCVLIQGSCAAEGITDGRNGILIEENAASLAAVLGAPEMTREALAAVGQHVGHRSPAAVFQAAFLKRYISKFFLKSANYSFGKVVLTVL